MCGVEFVKDCKSETLIGYGIWIGLTVVFVNMSVSPRQPEGFVSFESQIAILTLDDEGLYQLTVKVITSPIFFGFDILESVVTLSIVGIVLSAVI